ncbi:mask-1 [Symbiodinium necroappetens]|uniref:Mask-1 protein n=1 Tax=Symbiodinium necroappetens TaxID=1628268 RepID=A0A813CL09_9DINO|nr:mask-1 [Symbiodinium necroappetens]
MGRAIFVSHQWLGQDHPDPEFKQTRVLQEALQNLLSGASRVSIDVTTEVLFGHPHGYSNADISEKRLFLWYDFFSCPQHGATPDLSQTPPGLQLAIDSIPIYVQRCALFVILSPSVRAGEEDRILNYKSWGQRAWCRTESLARELCPAHDNLMIRVESSRHIALVTTLEKNSPGAGAFSFECDREKVAGIVRNLVKQKLLYCLRKGDLVSYRFLLNEQVRMFRSLPLEPFEGLIPGFELQAEGASEDWKLESFLYQMGFSHIAERDAGGFSPMCYAAVRGDPLLLESLLKQRADPNDRIWKTCPKLGISRNTSLLAVCAFNGHNECLRLLIAQRAGVDAQDVIKTRPLHAACGANNAEAVRMLCAVGADLSLKTARSCLSLTPFGTACAMGSVQTMKVLLAQAPQPLKLMLYLMMAFQNASVESAATLLQARADVNERFSPKTGSTLWLVNAAMRVKHRWRPTTFTSIAVNSWGATPLMVSIVAGLFDVAFLIVARADLEIRNTRGKTALMLAEEMQAPDFLRAALSGKGRADHLAHEIAGGPTGSATLNMLPHGSLVTLEL